MSTSGASDRRSGAGSGERGTGVDRRATPDLLGVSTYFSRSAAQRPVVQPVDPAMPGECLCGDPADFIVDTNWFSGRRSRDPVCERHVAEVVAAITKEQARRDGG
jgi:hypothetical protein